MNGDTINNETENNSTGTNDFEPSGIQSPGIVEVGQTLDDNLPLENKVIAPFPPEGVVIVPGEEYVDSIEGYSDDNLALKSISFFLFPVYLFIFAVKHSIAKLLGIYTRHQYVVTTNRFVHKREIYFLNRIIGLRVKSIPIYKVLNVEFLVRRNRWLIFLSFLCLIGTILLVIRMLKMTSAEDPSTVYILLGGCFLGIFLFYFVYMISTRTSLNIFAARSSVRMFHWGNSELLAVFVDRMIMTMAKTSPTLVHKERVDQSFKICQHCGNKIRASAIKCRFCKNMLT